MILLPCSPIPVAYVPRRSAAYNRHATTITLGIHLLYIDTNMQIRYTAAIDIDRKVSEDRLKQIVNTVEKLLQCRVVMICETCKGYHLYIDKYWYNPNRLIRLLTRLVKHVPEMDKYQVKLGIVRQRVSDLWMIVRIGGKYGKPDIDVTYDDIDSVSDPCHRNWLRDVKNLIQYLKTVDIWEIVKLWDIDVAWFR